MMEPTQMPKCFWEGPRIRLRALQLEDLDIWIREDSDSEAIRCLSYGIELPKHQNSAKEFAERYANFNNLNERIMFTIETLDGEIAGGINIHSMDMKNGTFSTGTRIYEKHRGKGYAGEAKHILLKYAFHELRYQKYNVSCIESNKAQIKALQKLGCMEEGRRRRVIYTNGTYYDELLFGMTKEEYDALYTHGDP